MENADSSPNTNPPQLQTHNEADMRFPQMLTETTETVKSPVDKCDELENSKGTDAEKRANGNEVTVENHLLRATTVGSEENKGSAERPPSPPRQPPYHQTKPSNESDELKLRVNDLDRELETLRNNVDRRRSGNAKKATASAATDGPTSMFLLAQAG
ncbi:MAG: hypothetical protein M1831_005482 [Alyxoria varia]|nr:MAG: hypothetical protein M1831_005482 [Alyxoria varia]